MEYGDTLSTVVSLGSELYAMSASDVDAMVILPPLSSVPNTPEHIRGMFMHRDKPVPVIDLRTRLGLRTLAEETDELLSVLQQREADHRAWLDELEASVAEGRQFALTTDPHACAFGKWYDTYDTDSLLVRTLLKKFDAPHKRIHAIAEEVLALEKQGDSAGAKLVIDRTRNGDLAEMVRLFALLRAQILESLREIAIVLSVDDRMFAVAVDSVMTVSRLILDDSEQIEVGRLNVIDKRLVRAIGKLDKSGDLVVMLDCAGIFEA